MTDDRDDAGRADTIASDGGEASAVPSGAEPAAAAAIAGGPGAQLGRYLLGAELGAGGMATVYRARDTELRRDVAVKVLFPHLARKDEVRRRFQREARAAASLEHANILRVYDVGDSGGGVAPFIVMELVRGVSLREVVEADGALLAELVASIGALLCDALAVAHQAGIVHRDVKPGNLMLADDGRLLLADFGVASLDDDDSLVTRTGALLGTPSFMSPEQAQGQPVDARSDLYSVGVTLYQLGTGSLPFTGGPAKIIVDAGKGAVPALRRHPAIGGELSRVIARLMAPDRAARPADAATAAAELRALATSGGLGEPIDELRGYAIDRAGWTARRRPVVVARAIARAEAAAGRGALAAALALCDRALAVDPAAIGATALAERLTRSSGRRQRLTGVGVAIAVVAVAAGGVTLVRGRAEPRAGAAADAGPGDDTGLDARSVAPAPAPDAASARDAGVAPPSDARAAVDAGPRRDAGLVASAVAIDAGAPIAIDAARAPTDGSISPAPTDAAPAPARIRFGFDTWCDLIIDGEPRGRADPTRPIELAPGRHRVECKQGLGQGSWSDTITVAAGVEQRVDGALLSPIVVVNAIADAVRIRGLEVARGESTSLRPGRHRVEILRGAKVVATGWVTLPRIARCTLRDTPELDCYP